MLAHAVQPAPVSEAGCPLTLERACTPLPKGDPWRFTGLGVNHRGRRSFWWRG